MAISDKSRKILWGKSANRCALCKRELVIDSTANDSESIVGEECHIESGKSGGPRFSPELNIRELDAYPNFILLCRSDHKMIDDQSETYTVEIIHQMKFNHEEWVSGRLENSKTSQKSEFKRVAENVPAYLIRMTSGSELLNLTESCLAYYISNDDPNTPEEVESLGQLFDLIRDWGDIHSDLGPKDKIETAFTLTEWLNELDGLGFWVFAAKEIQIFQAGEGDPEDWPVAIIKAVRKENESITKIDKEGVVVENSI